MFESLRTLVSTAISSCKPRRELALENLALRQQLAVFKRTVKRPKINNADQAFWLALMRLWSRWREALLVVKPATVIAWHRKGFRLFWAWKSRRRGGRPKVDAEIRALVQRMAEANVGWGAPRMHGELLKLGIEVGEATVSRYMIVRPRPPSQDWKTFLHNHMSQTAATDFFVVPTATFRLLFVFIVLHHERRRIVHFGVTAHPTS